MDYSKYDNNRETSSDEMDQDSPEKINDSINTAAARSYECNFCKRGFTNAQALGGHMNIHRKDKAKAKANKRKNSQQTTNSKINFIDSSLTKKLPINCYEDLHTSNSSARYFAVPFPSQFYFPISNPSGYPQNPYYQIDHGVNSENYEVQEENLCANLSLEIGASRVEDCQRKNSVEREDDMEHELDLELRLGHDPRR